MPNYFIHEANLTRLEKKVNSIKNKCVKNNMHFSYSLTGNEEFRTVSPEDESQKPYIARFVEIEVEGAIKHEGWKFAAVLEHHNNSNVVRCCDDNIQVPAKYFTSGPVCEHCNRIRSRKDTYLIVNEEGEFKQVGKSCLNEYTNGLDAEEVARFVSLFDDVIAYGSGCSGTNYERYLDVKETLRYAFECVNHFGYEKSTYDEYEEPSRSTRSRVSEYMDVINGHTRWYSQQQVNKLIEEMESVGFNPDSEKAIADTEAALEWIRSEKVDPNNNYISNLIAICEDDFTNSRDFGLLVSLPIAYLRHIEKVAAYEKKQKEVNEEAEASNYIGEVGQRLTVALASFKMITSFDGDFGTTWLYKMTDASGNVYMWYASKYIDDEDTLTSVTGTVKKHEEYRGVKQTVLTRCKVA